MSWVTQSSQSDNWTLSWIYNFLPEIKGMWKSDDNNKSKPSWKGKNTLRVNMERRGFPLKQFKKIIKRSSVDIAESIELDPMNDNLLEILISHHGKHYRVNKIFANLICIL